MASPHRLSRGAIRLPRLAVAGAALALRSSAVGTLAVWREDPERCTGHALPGGDIRCYTGHTTVGVGAHYFETRLARYPGKHTCSGGRVGEEAVRLIIREVSSMHRVPGRGDVEYHWYQILKHVIVAWGHGDTHLMRLMATRRGGVKPPLRAVGRIGGAVEGDVR